MKKYIINLLAVVLLSTTLTSCLKDDSLVLDPAKGHNVIEFANPSQIAVNGSIYPLYVFSYSLGSVASLPVTVSYSGPEATAPQDITVKFAVGAAATVTAYNANQSKSFEMMPAGNYTLPTNEVVIKQGQSKATFNVTFNTAAFDLTKSFVLPLTITSASSGIVSGNFNTILLAVGVRNIYDGIYSYSGSIIRNSATGPDNALGGTFSNFSRDLVTNSSPTQNTLVPLWKDGSTVGGIDGTYITVDPATNLVTVKSTGNATLKNTPGEVNKYDPATKTFTLAFDWGTAPATRIVKVTMVYKGPRP